MKKMAINNLFLYFLKMLTSLFLQITNNLMKYFGNNFN